MSFPQKKANAKTSAKITLKDDLESDSEGEQAPLPVTNGKVRNSRFICY
jgi:hypothetical protein